MLSLVSPFVSLFCFQVFFQVKRYILKHQRRKYADLFVYKVNLMWFSNQNRIK